MFHKCVICGKEVKVLGSHLRFIHNTNSIDYYINNGFDFANKEIIEKMYFIEKKSFKEIMKIFEKKYNIVNLKPTMLILVKKFNIKLRSISDANRNYIKNGGEVWNKGKTKEDSDKVKIYADKKTDLYKKVEEKLKSLEISELVNFNIQQNKKIRNILREKLIIKQNDVCPICKVNLFSINKTNRHIHHIDRNNLNNLEENLVVVCSSCHTKISTHRYRIEEIEEFNTFNLFVEKGSEINNIILDKIKKSGIKNFEYRKTKYENCEICGYSLKIDIHHIDANRNNNDKENLIFLCKKCHGEITGFNIKANSKNEMFFKLKEKKENSFNKSDYYNNTKEGGKWSIHISKLKLKEFVQ